MVLMLFVGMAVAAIIGPCCLVTIQQNAVRHNTNNIVTISKIFWFAWLSWILWDVHSIMLVGCIICSEFGLLIDTTSCCCCTTSTATGTTSTTAACCSATGAASCTTTGSAAGTTSCSTAVTPISATSRCATGTTASAATGFCLHIKCYDLSSRTMTTDITRECLFSNIICCKCILHCRCFSKHLIIISNLASTTGMNDNIMRPTPFKSDSIAHHCSFTRQWRSGNFPINDNSFTASTASCSTTVAPISATSCSATSTTPSTTSGTTSSTTSSTSATFTVVYHSQ
mmetsp:Transcript_22388/g.25475  ORF Transcript_22388/g.25475 Transcript_22388/m.25475 type:complete len:285 (+) Transcript_22388:695-1549(+)